MATATAPWAGILDAEELAHLVVEPARRGRSEPLPDELDPAVASALVAQGITALWRHQAETWEAARAASTSSSRPARRAARPSPSTCPCSTRSPPSRRRARSTSTRRRRSRRTRPARSASCGSRACAPAIYDGDTEAERRWQIRKWANVVLTNPDMLHVGVLPHHDRWGDVLHNLRYVVVDEAHVYRGVFGSHVANVLRRLRRLARAYGAEPQFVLASATIANPGELGERLLGVPVTVDRLRLGAEARAHDRALEPAAARRGARPARRARSARRRCSCRSSSRAACGRSASRRAARRPS